jgi:uncharacterized protein (DUF1800 family)
MISRRLGLQLGWASAVTVLGVGISGCTTTPTTGSSPLLGASSTTPQPSALPRPGASSGVSDGAAEIRKAIRGLDARVAAAHALNRLGFGPRPGDLDAVSRDVAAWVEAQLVGSAPPMGEPLASRLANAQDPSRVDPIAAMRGLIDLQQASQVAQASQPPTATGQAAQVQAPRSVADHVRNIQGPGIQSRLLRALQSPAQLDEVMVDFWYNHFNVFSGKNLTRVLTGHYEHHAIRPHAMGRFIDLLRATAHHPAMLYYLDNWQSVGGLAAQGNNRGLNENYARELMELHTLGVSGGYTQRDVTELARMFTGWTITPLRIPNPPSSPPNQPGFWFNPRAHDGTAKQWFGQSIAAQPNTALGKSEGDLALSILANHPATAKHLSRKLVMHFISDTITPDLEPLVAKLATAFLRHEGHIVPWLRVLVTDDAFWSAKHVGTKFKTPYHYALSMLRAGGFDLESSQPLANTLAFHGMPLHGCITPDGWSTTQDAWLNADAVNKRINLATQVANARLGNAELLGSTDVHALTNTLGPLVHEPTRQLVQRHRQDASLASALVLAGPGMMRR